MGKKTRANDAGLEYLKKINFAPIKGYNGLVNYLENLYGKKKATEILDNLNKSTSKSVNFYELKNSSLELSMAFNQAFDGDIIRKNCNYIATHKKYFGKTILEVGCESGNMTGFLALTFPESKIVAIDRSTAAIEIAKQRLKALNVNNVEFRCTPLHAMEEQFDTVFCSRIVQENLGKDDYGFEGESLDYQFAWYMRVTDDFTKSLMKCVNPQGHLCVFERIGHNPLLCGWLFGLEVNGLGCIPETYEEIICTEQGETSTFQGFVCAKGQKADLNWVYDTWVQGMHLDVHGSSLTGWAALNYLRENAGRLIRGVYIIDKDGYRVGRFALFTDCDSDRQLYYLKAVNNVNGITLYNVSPLQKDAILKLIQDNIDDHLKLGFTYEDINPEIDNVEGKQYNFD